MCGVQHERDRERVVREVREERGAGETDETAMSAEETQRADGVRRFGAEPAAPLARQRLRKDEQPVQEVREREDGRRPKRRAQVDACQEAAECRPDDESDTECDAEHAEPRRTLLGWSDVRDVCPRRAERGRRDARDKAADEEDRDRRRERHDDVVRTQAEVREKDHGSPSEAVRERAEERRGEELHERERGAEDAEHACGARGIAAFERDDELGKHGDDHAERDHVEQDRDEDEDERGTRARDHDGIIESPA